LLQPGLLQSMHSTQANSSVRQFALWTKPFESHGRHLQQLGQSFGPTRQLFFPTVPFFVPKLKSRRFLLLPPLKPLSKSRVSRRFLLPFHEPRGSSCAPSSSRTAMMQAAPPLSIGTFASSPQSRQMS